MGGWNYKGKVEAFSLVCVRAKMLKDKGFFKASVSGLMSWTNSYNGKDNSIGIQTYLEETKDHGCLRVYYSQMDSESGEKKDFDYKVPITSTPCHYGGRRFWFICPLGRNDVPCGRRTNVLYKKGDYFGCRKCHRLTYNTQNQGGRYKGFVSIPDIEEAEMKVGRRFYRGKPTRKYRRVLKLNERFEDGWIQLAIKLGAFDKKFKL